MRASIGILILVAISTGAFAEDKNQASVYDDFRQWMKPLPNATVDEEITAIIKRHMANLLYPVDMTSFVRPEKDEKFRQQVIALQKQMGEPAIGTLTSGQFDRLATAAHDVDDRPIGAYPGKVVARSNDGGEWVMAVGTGTTDDRDNPLAHPINISRIFCVKASGTCELSTAEFSPEESQIFFEAPFDYSITTWTPTRVTATSEHPCGSAMLSLDIQAKSVTVSSVPHSDLSFCSKSGPSTWRLADDGFPITWKIHQDKVNKARALVYEPERRLMPPVADASTK
jgi:hypothetical protein